jgi:dihydroxyacetone kinase
MQRPDAHTETKWNIKPTKIYSAMFETSLNGPGFSITLCNLTAAANKSKTSVSELMDLLGAETKAPSWPNVQSNTSTKEGPKETPIVDIEKRSEASAKEDIKGRMSFVEVKQILNFVPVDPKLLDASIRLACERAIAAEPNLTKWDMVMGDGDCGEAVKGVSEGIIALHIHNPQY